MPCAHVMIVLRAEHTLIYSLLIFTYLYFSLLSFTYLFFHFIFSPEDFFHFFFPLFTFFELFTFGQISFSFDVLFSPELRF